MLAQADKKYRKLREKNLGLSDSVFSADYNEII